MAGIMHEPTKTVSTPKPTVAVRLSLATIPKSLKTHNRWILWKYTLLPNGKWTKTPHSPSGHHKIDATNFANGASFEIAVQSLRNNRDKFDGLGFLLGEGIAGIDVDDCIDENGNLNERGLAVSEKYRGTYAEISPSGRGFKLLVDIGDDPKLAVIGKNTAEMEIYGGRRYFTVTGAKLQGHADGIAQMADAFAATAAQLDVNFSKRLAAEHAAKNGGPAELAPMPEEKGRLGLDMKAARELLDHLPFKWCDEYGDWIRGGMALHHEFDGSMEALQLWDEYSQRSGKYDAGGCGAKWMTFGKPGKDIVSVRTLVREAQSTGWRAPPNIESAIRDFSLFDEPTPSVDNETGELSEPPTWWARYSVGDLLRMPAPEKEWVWKGVLRAGKLLVLAGSGGSSKSYLMLAASVQYALGNNWGPLEIPEHQTPGRVLMLYGEEDKADIHDRVQVLKHTFMLTDEQVDTVAERVAVLPLRGSEVELAKVDKATGDIVMTEQLDRLEKRIKEYGVKLVIMDPMALLHSLEENDNHAIASFVSGLDGVCMRTGTAIVLVHHFGKGGEMTARSVNEANVRGASSLVAHARTVVVMHRLRRDEATSWGVTEDEASKWVLWAIAKNNYGPSGLQYWYEVNPTNGAIMPGSTQLEYLNARDIRAAAQAHAESVVEDEITGNQERAAREAAERVIEEAAHMRVMLRYCATHGEKPARRSATLVLREGGFPGVSERRGRAIMEKLENEQYIHKDGVLTEKGDTWLQDQEWLNGVER